MTKFTTLLALGALAVSILPAGAQTLKTVKDRGTLNCGVSQGLAGFSQADDKGVWSGFDVDFCKAVAAAVFDDATKVKYVPLNADARFKALQDGSIDVLARNSTWTLSREGDLKLMFGAVTYYDGQGFMVGAARNVGTVLELADVKVCVQQGTTTELNLADYFKANNIAYQAVTLPSVAELVDAYNTGKCDVLTSDVSALYSLRLKLTKPADHIVLPDVISKEPLAPVVRQGDDQWLNIVKWTAFALLNAEELGVTSKNLDEALKSVKPDVKRLVGTDGAYGEQIGLTKDWVVRIVKAVGNYGELFDRNVGVDSPLGIPRGINQLWSVGGIQYAPPVR